MSSGAKEMFINTQERAVSTDINRMQKFSNSDRAELFRYLFDVTGNDDLDAGGLIAEPTTLETPLRAEIINGILVRPQLASLNLLVDPGVMYALSPDAAPDDSNYKFIHDLGITTLGALTMTGNVSGSTRIDVIECQPVYNITETDNRDIFNPVTGLFAATSVTKAKQGALTYRVRQGTPGGGMPANQVGWLPLTVASVPTGTTSCDTITFWDVRPLITDREVHYSALTRSYPRQRRQRGNMTVVATHQRLSGLFENGLNGRIVGGRMRPGGISTDVDYLQLDDTNNVSAGYVLGNLAYVYLCTPFGLPRWARYHDAGFGARTPRSPRGIPVVSNVGVNQDGSPLSAVALPTSTGLGGSTTAAVLIAAVPPNALNNATFDDVVCMMAANPEGSIDPAFSGTPPSTIGTYTFDATAVYNRYFPANAKAIWVNFIISINSVTTLGVTAPIFTLAVKDASGNIVSQQEFAVSEISNPTAGTINMQTGFNARIPLPCFYPNVAPQTHSVVLTCSSTSFGMSTFARMTFNGWEI